MAGEIDGLVTAPQQRAVGLHTGKARAHEEQRFAGFAAAFNGLGVDLCPERRPGIVHQLGVDAVR
ncbi:hypothetical protein D3C72_2473010 [compost metagenome]